MRNSARRSAIVVAFLFFLSLPAFSQSSQRKERVIIKTSKPYSALVTRINALGGMVRHQYKFIDAIAADIPVNALDALRTIVGPGALTKDIEVPLPRTAISPRAINVTSSAAVIAQDVSGTPVTVFPGNPGSGAYLLNLAGLNLTALHAGGITGNGVVVAVIDSGLRPGFPALELDGSIVGCENFVDSNSDGILDGACNDSANDPHGTFIAGMISANAKLDIAGSPMLDIIKEHLPAALTEQTVLPLIGSAPQAGIYALRVFGGNALAGAPQSRLIEAIDRVIELRTLGVEIRVCNLSFGISALEPGTDPLDLAVDALLNHGIVPVVAVGNVGPSSLTASSPASAKSSLSVGASGRAENERIYWDFIFGAGSGVGLSQRPVSGSIHTAYFSSRGPHADGRIDPDVIVNGFGNVGQGFAATNDVSAEAGTSYSTPIVAGVAAVLIQAFPGADPIQILNAIVMSANPLKVTDGSTQLDQGKGFVDAQAAYNLLQTGNVPNRLPDSFNPTRSVRNNIERGTPLRVMDGTLRYEPSGTLKPGQRFEILYFVRPNTDQIVINLDHFEKNMRDPGPRDFFFADDISLNVHGAKTSQIGAFGDYLLCDPKADPGTCPPLFGVFTRNGRFVIDDPEPGIMRITLMGSTTNRGDVSTDVSVTADIDPLPQFTVVGTIEDGKDVLLKISIPRNIKTAEFHLTWKNDWANYPTSDVDMTVFDPLGNPILVNGRSPGATLDHPERIVVSRPAIGDWGVVIKGFDIPSGTDDFKLRVILDGTVLK